MPRLTAFDSAAKILHKNDTGVFIVCNTCQAEIYLYVKTSTIQNDYSLSGIRYSSEAQIELFGLHACGDHMKENCKHDSVKPLFGPTGSVYGFHCLVCNNTFTVA